MPSEECVWLAPGGVQGIKHTLQHPNDPPKGRICFGGKEECFQLPQKAATLKGKAPNQPSQSTSPFSGVRLKISWKLPPTCTPSSSFPFNTVYLWSLLTKEVQKVCGLCLLSEHQDALFHNTGSFSAQSSKRFQSLWPSCTLLNAKKAKTKSSLPVAQAEVQHLEGLSPRQSLGKDANHPQQPQVSLTGTRHMWKNNI